MEDRSSRRNRLRTNQLLYVGGFLLLLLIARGIIAPQSLDPGNLLDILRQAAPLGLVAIGQTIALLIGGIDLSVTSVITLTNVIAAKMMIPGNGAIAPALVVVMLVALAIGAANGALIVFFRLPAIITTLAMSIVVQGGYYLYTKGSPVGNIAPGFRVIADGHIGAVPWAAVIWALVVGLVWIVLNRTSYGVTLYACGGNPRAAFLSGHRHRLVTVSAYMLSALFACFAGLMLSAYIGVASTSVGSGYDLSSIAATVIGGTAFTGGEGGIVGTVLGVLILTVLNGLLTVINISDAGKLISQGAIIILMMATQVAARRR